MIKLSLNCGSNFLSAKYLPLKIKILYRLVLYPAEISLSKLIILPDFYSNS